MTKDVETIVASLKGIIDKNGPGYLEDEPYAVYNELIESGAADRKTAATLLHFLAMGLLKGAKFDDAELVPEITATDLLEFLSGKDVKAGTYEFFDTTAVQMIKRSNLETVITNGFEPENLIKAVNGENIGTRIINE